MRDFTLDAYMSVVEAIQAVGLPIYGVAQWQAQRPASGALIRHDVDRRPANALAMARAEAVAGVATTYYFRVVGSAYDKATMRAVQDLGHEVGYHYEDLALAKGDPAAAIQSFQRHLTDLRQAVDVRTAAMHGSPMSRVNNLDLWRHAKITDFGLSAEAFLSVDYAGLYYFTDTGRSWGAGATNLRDRPAGTRDLPRPIHRTTQLVDFIRRDRPQGLAFSVHPERWDASWPGWLAQSAKDQGINLAKVIVSKLR
jgi:hypothetical protein